jgi:hypothetical protein
MSPRETSHDTFYAPNVLVAITDENWTTFKNVAMSAAGVKVVGKETGGRNGAASGGQWFYVGTRPTNLLYVKDAPETNAFVDVAAMLAAARPAETAEGSEDYQNMMGAALADGAPGAEGATPRRPPHARGSDHSSVSSDKRRKPPPLNARIPLTVALLERPLQAAKAKPTHLVCRNYLAK